MNFTTDKIDRIKEYIKSIFANVDKAHDYYHTERVYQKAIKIAESISDVDLEAVKIAALLHDVDDLKLSLRYKKDYNAKLIMSNTKIDKVYQLKILTIINEVSFSKGKNPSTIESSIVQDADRLDALGAIGIARAFTYGGKHDRPIYACDDSNCIIQHFYDKLLKLESLMNTDYAKKEARQRAEFMKTYLEQLNLEIGIK